MKKIYPKNNGAKTYKTWSRKGDCPGCSAKCGSKHRLNCRTRESLLKQLGFSSKNKKLLDSFTKYCEAHPSERFWQSLRNWSEYQFIYGFLSDSGIEDTFYLDIK